MRSQPISQMHAVQIPKSLHPCLPLIVFDGECGLCNRLAGSILAHQSHDPARRMFVTGGESAFGKRLLIELGIEELAETTILFVTAEGVLTRMDASYAIWRRLRAPWSWLPFLYAWLPTPLLNAAYDSVATRRKRQVCHLSDMAWREKYTEYLLDDHPFPS